MRFRLNDAPFWTLLFLPLIIAYYGYGILMTLALLALWALFRQAVVLYGAMTRSSGDDRMILESLPVSHYVDKVRWCLDRLGQKYEEESDVGILGVFFIGRMVPALRIPGKNMILYNSSDILRYLYGLHAHDPEKSAFLKPTKEALEMESKIDKMGFNLRRYAYYHLLLQAPTGDEGVLKLWGIHVDSIPQWQKILLRFLLPVLKKFLLTILKVDRDGAAIGLRKSKEFFKETDELLSDGRKFLLGTEEPTFVDFSFATLAAIHVLPDNYGGSQLNAASKPRISDTSAEHKKDILEFAKTPSGKFVARMYKDYREV